ncbi:hypothetical protein PVAP13_2NG167306 [Panicum virgatum]|uniref:Uncharacterized protein n=1 Tax=Panicum virgatum TaxID=38727 RepID=A0A8T0VMF5_PANVG|nr:hypothetical protein PVAP13_2NG167306 [Panicum virgatum]
MASIQPPPLVVGRHLSTLGLASIQPPSSPILRRHASVQPSSSTHRGGVSTWEIADSRGGLLLLYRGVELYGQLGSSAAASRRNVPGLVVCDPLERRYTPIPCPRDLDGHKYLGLFLLDGGSWTGQPAGSDDRIGMSSFRVMAALHRPHAWEPGRGVPVAYVFSSGQAEAAPAPATGTS